MNNTAAIKMTEKDEFCMNSIIDMIKEIHGKICQYKKELIMDEKIEAAATLIDIQRLNNNIENEMLTILQRRRALSFSLSDEIRNFIE